MANTTVKIDISPKQKQKEIIEKANDPKIKRLVVTLARQTGKSFVCRYLALKWIATPGTVVAFLTLTKLLGRQFYKSMVQMIPEQLIKQKDGSRLQIDLINKSTIIFFSVEQVENVRGFTLDYLIWDECAFAKEYTPNGQHIFENILDPLLDVKGKKILFISTPNGSQGFFYNLYLKAHAGEKGYSLVRGTVHDDETKTAEWIEERKKSKSDKAWRQEYMCEFLEGGASYFTGFSDIFKDYEFNNNSNLWAGLDFSSTGDDNTILTFINSERQIKQYAIAGGLDEKYRKISELLNNNSNKISGCYFESNSIGGVMGNEIEKMLNPALKKKIEYIYTSNTSKKEYIELLAMDIEKGSLSALKSDEDLLGEFKVFTYKLSQSKQMTFGALPGYHDDRIISLALANLARHNKSIKNRSYFKALNL
jgi:hypothetical protein